MSDGRLVFEHSVEGMYLKGHPKALTPGVKEALRNVGIDLDRPLKSSYPATVVHEATRLFRRIAYAHEPDDMKAYVAMGAATVDGYFDTVIGRAFAGVLKLIGFKRLIERLPQAMSGGSNYTQVTVTWQGPSEVLVSLTDVEPHVGINFGVLQRGLSHWFGGKNLKVELHSEHPPGAVYRITFEL